MTFSASSINLLSLSFRIFCATVAAIIANLACSAFLASSAITAADILACSSSSNRFLFSSSAIIVIFANCSANLASSFASSAFNLSSSAFNLSSSAANLDCSAANLDCSAITTVAAITAISFGGILSTISSGIPFIKLS